MFCFHFTSQGDLLVRVEVVRLLQPAPVPPVLHAGVRTVPLPLLLTLGQQPDDPPQLAVEAREAAPDEDQDKQAVRCKISVVGDIKIREAELGLALN